MDKNWMDKPIWCPFAKQLITFTLVAAEEAPKASASAVDVVTLEDSPVKPSDKTPTPTSEAAPSKLDSNTASDDAMPENLRDILTEILATGSPQKSQQAVAGTDKRKPCDLTLLPILTLFDLISTPPPQPVSEHPSDPNSN